MKRLTVKSLKPQKIIGWIVGSSALGISAVGLLATPAIAQQRPSADTGVCSAATQSCSSAILADGPLSVSASQSNQLIINSARESTLEQVSNSVNEQSSLENNVIRLGIGPVDINSGDRDRLGIRDNVRD